MWNIFWVGTGTYDKDKNRKWEIKVFIKWFHYLLSIKYVIWKFQKLKQNNTKYGAAGICNGEGGASATVIENI